MVCWQYQSHCVAELLPGWASPWLKLPSKWSATAYNIFLRLSVSNIDVRLSILQSVICKSLSWAEKWIFYVLWYVDIHSYVASKNLWAMPKSIYSMCGFTCHMPNLTNANVATRWTMKDKRRRQILINIFSYVMNVNIGQTTHVWLTLRFISITRKGRITYGCDIFILLPAKRVILYACNLEWEWKHKYGSFIRYSSIIL